MTKREMVHQLLANNPEEQAKVISKKLDMPHSTTCSYVREWKRENKIPKKPTIKDISYEGFKQGKGVKELVEATGASRSTVASYKTQWKRSTGERYEATDEAIAKELNITRREVKEAYQSALAKMKEYLMKSKINDFNDFNDLYYIQAYITERLDK